MTAENHLVVFSLDEWRLALPLTTIERIVRAVEITPLPGAPDSVLGAINVRGRIVPVINIRRLCRLSDREPELNDLFVIARTSSRMIAFPVDSAGVAECAPNESSEPDHEASSRIANLGGELTLVHDLDRLIEGQEQELNRAMRTPCEP